MKTHIIDKEYCMSHYLAFRYIRNTKVNFFPNLLHTVYNGAEQGPLYHVSSPKDIDEIIRNSISEYYVPGKTAIFLSSGIDSAILASYLPSGTPAYTFHCVAEGAINETHAASRYCEKYGLTHIVVPMNWSDFEELTPEILAHDSAPFHSIEVQLVKAIRVAQSHGIERIILGEGADVTFGGLHKLLSREWSFDAFVERFTYVRPEKVLKNPVDTQDVFEPYRISDDKIDYLSFVREVFGDESASSYMHAFDLTGISTLTPFTRMSLANSLDLNRIRNGEPKYLLRELFAQRYPDFEIPNKIPMPRAMDQWLANYTVTRPEFLSNCTNDMNGDQKWLCWCLEQFLNIYDK